MRVVAAAVAGLLMHGSAVLAQDAAPPSSPPAVAQDPAVVVPPAPAPNTEDGRYTVHRVQDQFVRLDGRTGQVSTCSLLGTVWTCHPVPDERAALEAEIGRLQADNGALKRQLLARGQELPKASKPEVPTPPVARAPERPSSEPYPRLPSEGDLERMKTFVAKVWQRLVEMMAELQRDIQRKS